MMPTGQKMLIAMFIIIFGMILSAQMVNIFIPKNLFPLQPCTELTYSSLKTNIYHSTQS